MKKIYLLLILILSGFYIQAQYTVSKKTLTDIGVVNNGTAAMTIQADEKIVVAGFVQEGNVYKLCVIRYKQSGVLDAGFGNNGIDTFTVSKILPAYQGASFRSVIVQPDGKILLAGSAWFLAGVNYLSNVLVMRLNVNGTIDSTFGDNGTVRTNINSSTGLSVDEANDVKLQTDGKILVAGQTFDYLQHRFLLLRYNSDGSLDNNFGNGGSAVLAIGISDDEAFSLSLQANGKIILAGESYLSGGFSYRAALARFTAKGSIDNSFGNNGIVTTNLSSGADVAKDVAIQDDGKIVIGGFTQNTADKQNNILCIRYNSTGTIDTGFGNNGNVVIDVQGQNDVANKIIIQPDNKILLGGYSTTSDSISEFLSIRLKPDGRKDNNYASGGIETTSSYQQGDVAYGMSILSNGKIVFAGQTTYGPNKYISLVRYNKNGSPDSNFQHNGIGITGIGSSEDIAYKMIKVPWDKSLLVAGTANGYWTMVKYNPVTLKPDPAFGINGIVSVKYRNLNNPQDEPNVAIDAKSKKIYIAGYTDGSLIILRFNEDGTPDKLFGKNGIVNYSLTIYYGGFGLQNDHKILFSGVRQISINGYDFIARLNSNGTLDSSFGNNGEVRHLSIIPYSIEMKKDGSSILLGGMVSDAFSGSVGVLSMKTDGSYDQSFGNNGLIYKKSSEANAKIFFKYSLTQDDYGRILLSGGVQGGNFKFQFSVTRFLKQGVIDSSFAKKGQFVKDVSSGNFSDNSNEGISTYCSNGNCSILTSGIKKNDGNEQSTAVAILLKDNGIIDSLNTGNGYIDTTFFADQHEAAYAALIDTEIHSIQVMFIAGKGGNSNSDFELIQLLKPVKAAMPALLFTSPINYHLNVTPNPAHDLIRITYSLPQAEESEIKLTGFNGKVFNTQKQYKASGLQHITLQLPASLTRGIYFITVSAKQGSNVYKIIVQ